MCTVCKNILNLFLILSVKILFHIQATHAVFKTPTVTLTIAVYPLVASRADALESILMFDALGSIFASVWQAAVCY